MNNSIFDHIGKSVAPIIVFSVISMTFNQSILCSVDPIDVTN